MRALIEPYIHPEGVPGTWQTLRPMGGTASVPVLRVFINDDSPLPGGARCLRTRVIDLGLPVGLLPHDYAPVTAAIVGWRGHSFGPLAAGLHYTPGCVVVTANVAVYSNQLSRHSERAPGCSAHGV